MHNENKKCENGLSLLTDKSQQCRGKCLRRSGQKVARNKMELDGYQRDCLIEPDVKKSKKRLACLARSFSCVCVCVPMSRLAAVFAYTQRYTERASERKTSAAAGAAQKKSELKKKQSPLG